MPNVIEINDFSAPELDIYARLTENQLVNRADPENAMFIAESPVVIERGLRAGLHADRYKARRRKGAGAYRALRGHSGFRCAP